MPELTKKLRTSAKGLVSVLIQEKKHERRLKVPITRVHQWIRLLEREGTE